MKKRNLAVFAVILSTLVIGFFSLMTSGTNAQKSATDKTDESTCTGKPFVMPASISVNNELFADFIKVASLPMKERRESFSKQSNEQKANYVKTNLALQLIKRPDMTNDQKAFVLDSMSKVSADIYNKSDPEKVRQSRQSGEEMENRALGLFAYKDLGDFIDPMQTDKVTEVALLQKYEDLLMIGSKTRMKAAKEMPVNERINIWKVQLAYHLITGKFTKVQNEFIVEQLASLSPETFASRENFTEAELTKFEKMLIDNFLRVFSKDEAFGLFMTIGIQKYIADEPANENKSAPSTCNCNRSCAGGNQWCTGKNGCTSSPIGDCGPWGSTRCHSLCE
jgi:hypothetical protein